MARDRIVHNDVVSDVASSLRARRGEVLSGIERRRKWSDDTRLAIVSEALEPGTVVSHVARRHDLNPSQLFGWLRQHRAEAMALRAATAAADVPAFAPAMLDLTPVAKTDAPPMASSPTALPAPDPCSIEISIGTATVRIRGAADAKTLAMVLKALRALA
jgi:transposase